MAVSLRNLLKASTQDEHESLERVLGLESPGLTREAYARYLQGMRSMLAAVEPELMGPGLSTLGVDLAGRAKLPWLDADLGHFGLAPSVATSGLPPMGTPAQRLGCAYVFEGATLGGASLYERLAARWSITADAGATYLYGYGPETGPMWRRFVEMLDAAPLGDAGRAECVAAARATFASLARLFGRQEPARGA